MEIVSKIVLTGGPCAGKTTVLNSIKEYLEKRGYKIFIVSETATELINSGIKMFGENPIKPIEFQRLLFKMQICKEELIKEAIEKYNDGKAVIIYDRGLLDNKAYITNGEFNEILNEFNLTELELCKRYDAVIHLNTSALMENLYTIENNKARSESKEQAIELDRKTYNAWNLHSNLYTVKPESDFDIKIKNVFDIIDFEVLKNVRQNKYLVEIKDLKFLEEETVQKQLIEQFYLETEEDKEIRLRKINYDNSIRYELCEKRKTENVKIRKELTTEINKEMYEKLKELSNNIIRKKRYNFTYNYQHLILDIFDDNDYSILETNSDNIDFPNSLNIIEDVSENEKYRNRNLIRGVYQYVLNK